MNLIKKSTFSTAVDSGNGPVITGTGTLIKVQDSYGEVHELTFDHDPTADEIAAQLPLPPTDLTPTASKAVLLPIMKERIFEAQAFDWFNTKAQAGGALTAPQKTAVGNLNTQLYQRARAAVAAWYGAAQ